MKILIRVLIASTLLTLMLVTEGCKDRNDAQSTSNDNDYDIICLEDVDVVNFADSCTADTVNKNI